MKTSKICIWFLILTANAVLVNSVIISRLPLQSQKSWSYLKSFDTRLAEFRMNKDSYDAFLVGPSYCSNLGSFPKIANLGFGGGNHSDVLQILRDCPKDKAVFYVLTFRELLNADQPPKWWATYAATRRLAISKLMADELLAKRISVSDPKVSQSDLHIFENSIDTNLDIQVMKAAIKQIKRLPDIENPDFAPFLRLHEEHPSVVFVLHPTLPVAETESTAGLAAKLNRIASLNAALHEFIEDNHIPHLKLTEEVSASEMRDMFHITNSAMPAFREKFDDIVGNYLSKHRFPLENSLNEMAVEPSGLNQCS